MKNLIATIKSWNIENARKLQERDRENEWHVISEPKEFSAENVAKINPRYIFVPHWSWMIPEEIWGNYETIIFHATDLPFCRGGSPIQNLIARDIYQTKISAIRADKDVDSGPIYMKEPLDMSEGTVEDILKNASNIMFRKMIPEITKGTITPTPQQGEPLVYKRRTPEQGNLVALENPTQRKLYDYIRMLDGEGYPRAYVPFSGGRIEFYGAKFDGKNLEAKSEFVKDE